MTISTTDWRIAYNGNDVTTVFSFPYRFLSNSHLFVIEVSADGTETTKEITTHYTVTGAGDDAGGSVTMLVAPATGVTLVIYRDTEVVQETDYVSGDPFPAESHETALDKLTMIMQEKTPGGGPGAYRSIVIPIGDPSTINTVLPPSVARYDKFLTFDSDGDVTVSSFTVTQILSLIESAGLAAVQALTAGATVDVDVSVATAFTLTPTQNFTLNAPTNPSNGMVRNFVFTQGATPYTITWDAAYQFPGGIEPALTASASAVDFMSMYYNAATAKWICVMNKDFKA